LGFSVTAELVVITCGVEQTLFLSSLTASHHILLGHFFLFRSFYPHYFLIHIHCCNYRWGESKSLPKIIFVITVSGNFWHPFLVKNDLYITMWKHFHTHTHVHNMYCHNNLCTCNIRPTRGFLDTAHYKLDYCCCCCHY